MKKGIKRVCICLVLAASVWTWALVGDRKQLNEELIRLHVVANSDSEADQAIKLRIRDAVIDSIQKDLAGISDVDAARSYLTENLPKIEETVRKALEKEGIDPKCMVSLCREAYDTRYYDTFALPAGVYESLRIVIGEGAGKNWWCVAFPGLCLPKTSGEFEDAAVGAGFSEQLTGTLSGNQSYEIRFFALDTLGRIQNILFEE